MLLLAKDMLDLAVRLRVVGAILHKVGFADVERLQHLVVLRAGNEGFRGIRNADNGHFRADRHIDPLRFAIPHILAAIAEIAEGNTLDLDIDGSGRRNDAGLVAGNLIFESLALLQLDDVEVVQRNSAVLGIDNRIVPVVIGGDMHRLFSVRCDVIGATSSGSHSSARQSRRCPAWHARNPAATRRSPRRQRRVSPRSRYRRRHPDSP